MKKIHKSAEISANARIGKNTFVWNDVQVREGVVVGDNCILAKGVYVDKECIVGNNVKIQNYASLYKTTIIHDGVFVGPYVCFTNDKKPRATNSHGVLRGEDEWESGKTIVMQGVSIGAGSIILPGITIGQNAMIGAGSVVTKDVEEHSLIMGNPASLAGYVCTCGELLTRKSKKPLILLCKKCQQK